MKVGGLNIIKYGFKDPRFYSGDMSLRCFAMREKKTPCFTVCDIVLYSGGERIKVYKCGC